MSKLIETLKVENEKNLKKKLMEMTLDEIYKLSEISGGMFGLKVDATVDGDYFQEKPTEGNYIQRVPVLIGFNSTEMAGIHSIVTPGLADGFDEETGKKKFLEAMPIWDEKYFNQSIWPDAKKTFNFNPNDSLAYSKLHSDLLAHTYFTGPVLNRCFENGNDQPMYLYVLDVQWKMFHDKEYMGNSTKSRVSFCRSDHTDDLMMIFGLDFISGDKFIHGKQLSEDEKKLSLRMMTVWSNFAKTGKPGINNFKPFSPTAPTFHKFGVPNDAQGCCVHQRFGAEYDFFKKYYYSTE